MDDMIRIAGDAAQAGAKIGNETADANHVAEFERLMKDGQAGARGVDQYLNPIDTPTQWLSEAVIRAGKEVSHNYHENVHGMALKLESINPSEDPMTMMPRLVQVQMEMNSAAFQLQFTTSLVHLANNGVKQLFQMQG